jgi:hypothetical protein
MPSGHQWLQRLVWAVVYVFGVKHGIGNDTLSEFFHLLRLERRIGVSPSAVQGIRVKLEEQILTYNQEQQQQLQQLPTKVEVCAGADETFFEQMVLVLLDLSSGYIFVEAQAKDRGYQTWQELVQQALGSAVEVKYLGAQARNNPRLRFMQISRLRLIISVGRLADYLRRHLLGDGGIKN